MWLEAVALLLAKCNVREMLDFMVKSDERIFTNLFNVDPSDFESDEVEITKEGTISMYTTKTLDVTIRHDDISTIPGLQLLPAILDEHRENLKIMDSQPLFFHC